MAQTFKVGQKYFVRDYLNPYEVVEVSNNKVTFKKRFKKYTREILKCYWSLDKNDEYCILRNSDKQVKLFIVAND